MLSSFELYPRWVPLTDRYTDTETEITNAEYHESNSSLTHTDEYTLAVN